MENLIKIQSELKAPKNQFNAFGKYKYRSCEDILEALKPLLLKYGCTLTVSDEVEMLGTIPVIKSTVLIKDKTDAQKVTAFAGIDPAKKGMDIAQCFGSSSSYARKYALNGLFLIDDTKDTDGQKRNWESEINESENIDTLNTIWKEMNAKEQAKFKDKLTSKKNELQ